MKLFTLAMNIRAPGWWVDDYTPGVTLHAQSAVANSVDVLVGCVDGSVQKYVNAPADSGGPIVCQVRTNSFNFGDLRARKQFGDVFVDVDASATDAGIVASLLADSWADTLASETLIGARSMDRLPIDLSAGHGDLNVNAALDFAWTGTGVLFGFDLSGLLKPVRTQLRTLDWIDLGQSVFLQGLRVTANTGGVARTVTVEYDGYPTAGGVFTLTMTHSGEVQLPYSFTPVIAHRIRLTPTDSGDTWELFSVEPIGPKAPEAVTLWQPQPTDHGLEGYQHVREVRPMVQGTGTCVLAATCEFGSFSFTIALTGAVQKLYLPCPANKGMLYGWSVSGTAVRVFADGFEIKVRQWGAGGAYTTVKPFGQPQTEGALI